MFKKGAQGRRISVRCRPRSSYDRVMQWLVLGLLNYKNHMTQSDHTSWCNSESTIALVTPDG